MMFLDQEQDNITLCFERKTEECLFLLHAFATCVVDDCAPGSSGIPRRIGDGDRLCVVYHGDQ
jgi:hypothetical protein